MLAHFIAAGIFTAAVPPVVDLATPARRQIMLLPGDASLDAQKIPRWEEPLDPSDVLDFVASADQILNPGETILSILVAPAAEGVAVGLIAVGGEHAPALDASARSVTLWLAISSGMQANSLFRGAGVTCGVQFTLGTSTGRTIQRSALVRIVEL